MSTHDPTEVMTYKERDDEPHSKYHIFYSIETILLMQLCPQWRRYDVKFYKAGMAGTAHRKAYIRTNHLIDQKITGTEEYIQISHSALKVYGYVIQFHRREQPDLLAMQAYQVTPATKDSGFNGYVYMTTRFYSLMYELLQAFRPRKFEIKEYFRVAGSKVTDLDINAQWLI